MSNNELGYLSLGEECVVGKLIKERSKQDAAYGNEAYGQLESGGGGSIHEDVICTYIDLDRLIQECHFDAATQNVQNRLMCGYTLRDIADEDQCDPYEIERVFRNAVWAIAKQNDRNWKETHAVSRNHRAART